MTTTTDVFELPPVAHIVADLDEEMTLSSQWLAPTRAPQVKAVVRSMSQTVARSVAVAVGTLATLAVGALAARGKNW
jgi:hypothetical protein